MDFVPGMSSDQRVMSRGWRIFVSVPFSAATAAAAWLVWLVGFVATIGCLGPSCDPQPNFPVSVLATAASGALVSLALGLVLWGFTSLPTNRLRRLGTWTAVGLFLLLMTTNVVLAATSSS